MSLTSAAVSNQFDLKTVRILAVDNDSDTGNLYATLLEDYGIKIKVTTSIREALTLLDQFVPDILICESRFLGESVHPLIQEVRQIAQSKCQIIPIFVTSTFPAAKLDENLGVQVEAYQIKPIDLNQLMDEVLNLLLLVITIQPLSLQDWLLRHSQLLSVVQC